MPDYLKNLMESIEPVSGKELRRAQARLDSLTKPPGSLGRLEELARHYAAIKGTESPPLRGKSIFVFAADHGVTAEGVSAYPADVTRQMVGNFLSGGAAINVLSRNAGIEVVVVDMGVNDDIFPCPGLIDKKIAPGTRSMVRGPAMTRQQAEESIQAGVELARSAAGKEIDILGTGDMGIGNTTPASAIMSVCGKRSPEKTTGRGTGIDDQTFTKKIESIKQAIQVNRPDASDPIDILSKVGGFEIGGITGFILGGAACRTPVVIDGLISGAGAVLAMMFNPTVADYIFPSHQSKEPGHEVFFERLGRRPLFDLGMRLGEGTGAVLAIQLIEAGVKIYNEMASFKEAGVSGKKEE
ncbi:nicotinate-nucleotide--dimethylbenzimidazole phosphoribosyltransferase [Candidatus Nitromaritima sp. SCGC AAA799-C22]|nr:nicotinate-nucleotide--dimethylbenzimidazole phosphoribosyltransferase [Candidatus Nitromaritima sp. SCGC AAA799-C22]